MQRTIILLSLLLAIVIGHGNLALAQADSFLADGQARAAAGDIKGALTLYEQATRDDPTSNEAFARLGGMQLMDQRYSDAIRSFQEAISLGDPGPRSFIGMGMSYLHIGRLALARAAFVEARQRGAENTAEIDNLIAWIDARQTDGTTPHP
jgi:Flp pilus assembly protein TadD